MAGTIVVDRIESDGSYTSTVNLASKVNFTGGMQIGGYDSAMMFRNRWINGKMEIEQRSGNAHANGISETAGTAGTAKFVNNGTSSVFCVDRMGGYGQTSGVWKMQKTTDVPTGQGFVNSLACTVTTAGSLSSGDVVHFVGNYIEGYNVADMNFGNATAQPFTISFWTKSSVVGTYPLSCVSGAGTTNWACVKHYTILQANTWEKKTITFPAPTSGGDTHFTKTNGRGIGVFWGFGGSSNFDTATLDTWFDHGASYGCFDSTTSTKWITNAGATFYITGVQFESGTTATPFEHRPYSLELSLCQRYYLNVWNGAIQGRPLSTIGHFAGPQNSNYFGMAVYPPVTMRATPSIHQANTASLNNFFNWPAAGNLGTATANWSLWGSGGGPGATSYTLLTTTTGPAGNNQPIYAGVTGFLDFQQANTMVALSSEL